MTPERASLKLSPDVDTRALMWTFDSFDEDHELERFFSNLPGFHNSKVLKEPLHSLDDRQKLRLLEAVIKLLDRTFSSNSLSDQVKRQRADICANAIELLDTPNAFPIIARRLACEHGYGPLQSSKIVDFVKRWGDRKDAYSSLDQSIFSIVVARVQQHDDSWFVLASDQLAIPETVLREHAAYADNLSLAMLIYVTRQQLTHIQNPSWPSSGISDTLSAASKFNVEDTSAELQHEFCAIWNEVVRKAQNGVDWEIPKDILKPIRHVYIRLHRGTNSAPMQFSSSTSDGNNVLDDPESYPVCNATDHVHDASASTTVPPPVTPVPHDAAVMSPVSSPDVPSLPVLAPLHVEESPTDPPPLDNPSPTHRAVDNLSVPVTSPDPTTARITPPHPTPETSTSSSTFTSPLSSALQPAVVSHQQNESPLPHSDPTNLSSSASSNTVIGDILHTGPSLSAHSPMTESDLRHSLRSNTATTAPSSLGIITETDPAATPETHGIPMPGMREANDPPHPTAGNRAMRTDTMNTLDPPPPPLTSFTDSDRTTCGGSPRELNAEYTGDRPLDPSRHQYDMV